MENYELNYNPGNLKAAMSGVKSGDLWKVPYEKLVIRKGFNARIHGPKFKERVERIAALIETNGYEQDKPIGVFIDGDEIVVKDGHTRHAAVGLLRSRGVVIESLPCVSVPRGTNAVDLTVSLVTANEGTPLSPLETGIVVKRLIGYGLDEDEVARRLSYSKSYIGQLLSLMEAPAELRKMVEDEKISASEAINLIKKHGAGALTAAITSLGNAEAAAIEKGQDPAAAKITKKHVELDSDTKLERAAKNKGLELYKIVKDMLEDQNFLKLNKDIRARVMDVFDAIDKKLA